MNFFKFIASLNIPHQKAVMFLSSESQTQNQKSKSQMMVSLGETKDCDTEKIWEEPGSFKDQRIELTIPKANFPENTLVYINQGSISQMKDGEAIYLEYVVLGQIMPVANLDPAINFDKYEFKEDECLLYVPLYNTENDLFRGLGKRLGYITLRGDKNETFYSYGYDNEKSKLLFAHLSNYSTYARNEKNVCRRERVVQFAADIYIIFVATFIRVNLNVYYDYFLKFPLTINDEKYVIRHIQHLVRDLSNEIWMLNVNYFFIIFEKFSKLNNSVCYDSDECSYEPLTRKKEYYGQLVVVSNSNLRMNNEYFISESESESEF